MHFFIPQFPTIYWKKEHFKWEIVFDESCKYNLLSEDQWDWNKLVGVKKNINPRKSSARWVWRWNLDQQAIEIGAYIENNYVFEYKTMMFLQINKKAMLYLSLTDTECLFQIDNGVVEIFPINVKSALLFKSFPYFGGNRSAPHCMKLKIK